MNPSLKFIHINVNGIRNKLEQVESLLVACSADVCFISETKLDVAIPDTFLNIGGFSFFRFDRGRKHGGGLLVYYKNDLSLSMPQKSPKIHHCELLTLKLTLSRRKSATFSLVYRPPNSDITGFLNSLEIFLQHSDPSQAHCIIGDLNIDLTKENRNTHALNYLNLLHAYGYNQIIQDPTRLSSQKASLIDHVVLNNQFHSYSGDVICSSISDHQAISLQWNVALERELQVHKVIEFRSMKNFDPGVFRTKVNTIDWSNFFQLSDPDVAWNMFSHLFLEVWDECAPLKKCRIRLGKKINKPWIDSTILKDMKLRDSLYRKFQSCRTDANWSEFKKIRNRVNTSINRSKFLYFKDHFSNEVPSTTPWKTVNSLIGKSKKTKQCAVDCNLLVDYFSSINNTTNNPRANFLDFLSPPPATSFVMEPCTPELVSKLLSEIKNSNSCGHDKISNIMLKHAGNCISNQLSHLFNLCIKTNVIPSTWKHAKVIPLHKKGDTSEPSNYRPISLLSSTSKLFERFLANQISSYFEQNSLFTEYQHGFRKKHSTQSAIISLTEKIFTSVNAHEFVVSVFLDLSKAFDTVNHAILLRKLEHYGFQKPTINLLRSYLTDRSISVYLNDDFSSKVKQIFNGVPQGSVLGPLLFIIYTNDVFNALDNALLSLYADDTSIYISGSDLQVAHNLLEKDTDNIIQWFEANCLKLNIEKSQFIIFGTRNMTKEAPQTPLRLRDSAIQRQSSVEYLGIVLDENLNFNEHVNKVNTKLAKALGPLNLIKHLMPFRIRKQVSQALVLPHIKYCITVWSGTSQVNISKISKTLNRACRQILCVNRDELHTAELYKRLGWLTVDQLINFHLHIDVFKLIHLNAPFSIHLPPTHDTIHSHFTRNRSLFQVPTVRNSYGFHSLSYRFCHVWNNLPVEYQAPMTFAKFKRLVKLKVASSDQVINQ